MWPIICLPRGNYGMWIRESDKFASAGSELPLRTAESRPLSIKYLRTVCGLLGSDANHYGPIAELREAFRDLPADVDRVRESCDEMAKRISENRKSLGFDFPHLQMPSVNRGSQVLVLWRNRRKASHRMTLNDEQLAEDTGFAKAVSDGAQQEDVVSAYETFCRVFPDEFFIDRRGREYLVFNRKDRDRETDYRLLSAGFHSMMGYFRDDEPLCELMLTSDDKQRLDDLWFDLNYASDVPRRQHSGFIWFERAEGRFLTDAEFDDFRSEDKNVISEEMIFRLRDAYRAKVERLGADDEGLEAVDEHFRIVNVNVRAIEAARDAAHDAHVALLPELAERAFRRPLTNDERIETIAFYHQLVQRDGLSHQDAIRDVLVSILVSPHFCYRLQPYRKSEDDNSVGLRRCNAGDRRCATSQPLELLLVVQYARRDVVAFGTQREIARSGGVAGTGATHVAGRPFSRAGARIRWQLAWLSAVRIAQQRGSGSLSAVR